MSQSLRPCATAFSHRNRFTCLLGDLDPERHVHDLLVTVRMRLLRSDGFMPTANFRSCHLGMLQCNLIW